MKIEPLDDLFYRVVVTFGFIETPNIPKALALARKLGWKFDIMSTSFFLSRRSSSRRPRGLPIWLDRLFHSRQDRRRRDGYFQLPTGSVVEIGTQVMV